MQADQNRAINISAYLQYTVRPGYEYLDLPDLIYRLSAVAKGKFFLKVIM